MTKLIIKNDDGISVLYLKYEKEICNYYGFKVCEGKIIPLPKDTIKILDIFKLSFNRKSLGVEDGYEVFLDCDTNFKHYFKNKNEDFDKFILMNSEDLTVYKDDENNNEKKGNFRKFLISNKFAIGLSVGIVLGICIEPWIILSSTYNEIDYYKIDIENTVYQPYNSKDIIINYINNSSNLNEKEKELLINDEYLNFIANYLNEDSFIIYLNDRLDGLDILEYTDESDPKHVNDDGYYQGDNLLHIKNYNEENPKEHTRGIGHEFIHLFQNPLSSVYVKEGMAAILNSEFYTNTENAYKDEVANIKGLMEIIGPEPLIKYSLSGDLTEIKNLVKDYLEPDDYNEFVRIISSNIHKKTAAENNMDNQFLMSLIYRMYRIKYGEVDHDFLSIIKNTTTVRYYFNQKYINEDFSYYIEGETSKDPIDLKKAYDLGILKCYIKKEISLEDYNKLSVEESKKYLMKKPIYKFREDNEKYDNIIIEDNWLFCHHETKGNLVINITNALENDLIKLSGYEISYEITYEESLDPKYNNDCQYVNSTGYIEDGMIYDYYIRVKHFVEPINKKFPKEEQKISF